MTEDKDNRIVQLENENAALKAAWKAGYSFEQGEFLAGRIKGDTPDELAADATALLELIKEISTKEETPEPDPGFSSNPGYDPSQGLGGGDPFHNPSPAEAFADMLNGTLRKV